MSEKIYDITIIGGGPVGMYASFYAAMQGLEVKLVDSLEHLGGQLTAIYPEKYIYDLPGHPKIRASEMIEQLNVQMNQYAERIDIQTATTVTDVVKQADTTFQITTTRNGFVSRSVLITAGNGAFNPRGLDVESDDVSNLHYFVTNMMQFKDKDVVIFGGGDSAVDWALMLNGIARSVSVVHRRHEFRAHASSIEKLTSSSAKVYTPYKASELIGSEGRVHQVVLEHLETSERLTLEVDDIIVLFGFVSSLGPIKDWGLKFRKTALTVDTLDQTNIEGIFAAGDAATFDGKIKMITTGFGEAVVAINAAKAYAYPDKVHRHQHSSTIGGS
ncbi:MAG: NAD(P)/FAD-dependent oxidoreductase [Defluviitaleaceae bacterium]|nr:NAD(P)/FAD-dependent oxidoreductase [Defluviitaleaceae bacterium]